MPTEVETVQAWAMQEARATEQLVGRAQAAAWSPWAAFTGWYVAGQLQQVAAQSAAVTEQARQQAGDLGVAYIREVLAGLAAARLRPFRLTLPEARLGADLVKVYSRPGEAYRSTYAVTEDPAAAYEAARKRLDRLVEDDVQIARRDGEHEAMVAAEVTGYRRIVHPERSITGVCGLCLAASDRIYSIEELLEVHSRCKCTVAPITDAFDPGAVNEVDLRAIYRAAGGTTDGRELKKTRFQVNEHGELGPVISKQGDRFQAEGDAPKGDPRIRAVKELAALEPVLASLQRRAAAGEDVAGPLGYQIDRVTKLRRIAAAA